VTAHIAGGCSGQSFARRLCFLLKLSMQVLAGCLVLKQFLVLCRRRVRQQSCLIFVRMRFSSGGNSVVLVVLRVPMLL
jgi:hypothetical protein